MSTYSLSCVEFCSFYSFPFISYRRYLTHFTFQPAEKNKINKSILRARKILNLSRPRFSSIFYLGILRFMFRFFLCFLNEIFFLFSTPFRIKNPVGIKSTSTEYKGYFIMVPFRHSRTM